MAKSSSISPLATSSHIASTFCISSSVVNGSFLPRSYLKMLNGFDWKQPPAFRPCSDALAWSRWRSSDAYHLAFVRRSSCTCATLSASHHVFGVMARTRSTTRTKAACFCSAVIVWYPYYNCFATSEAQFISRLARTNGVALLSHLVHHSDTSTTSFVHFYNRVFALFSHLTTCFEYSLPLHPLPFAVHSDQDYALSSQFHACVTGMRFYAYTFRKNTHQM